VREERAHLLHVGLPRRIALHRRPAAIALGVILVAPEMDHLELDADVRNEVPEQPREVFELDVLSLGAVQLEEVLVGIGLEDVDALFDDHA
jgi:hypothetical protein